MRRGRALETALTRSIDWDAVLDVADREFVSARLYRALRGVPAVPGAAIARLKHAYRQTAVRALSLRHALEEALAALAARGVAPLVLPGAALDLVDLDVDLGCPNDVDLMFERDRIEQALGVLGSLGYTGHHHEKTPGATLRFEETLTLTRSVGTTIRLALRWQLFDSPYRAAQRGDAWLRTTARRISIGAATALTLGREAQLLHLAGHLARHDRDVELRWLDDIAALLAAHGEPIDYPLLFRRASEWAVVEPLRASLLAADADWHAPLPPDARRTLLALRP